MKHVKLFEQFIDESRMDSEYLQGMLNDLAKDYKKQGEKDLYKFYDYLETRLNQSYPSGDVDRDDIEDIMRDSRFRSMKLDIPEWAIDDLFEQFLNEAIDPKELSQKVMKELDTFGQLNAQYQPKEVLNTIESVLKRYKSFGGKLTQKVAAEIRSALEDTGNLAGDAYKHIKDIDYIIIAGLTESVDEALNPIEFETAVKDLAYSMPKHTNYDHEVGPTEDQIMAAMKKYQKDLYKHSTPAQKKEAVKKVLQILTESAEPVSEVEDWGSSDMRAMAQSIHKDMGSPKTMPSPFDKKLRSAAEEAVDFWWDDWEEYDTDYEGLVDHAIADYLRLTFAKDFQAMKMMFSKK